MWSEVRAGRQGAADDRSARSVQEGLDCRLGVGHGEERTRNILYMLVTLEVSKLSGWLNALAYCRESKGGNAVQGEVYGSAGGRRQATTPRTQRAGGARLWIGGRARGGAHHEHVAHGCDAGGVEAQRLVEHPRALPRVEGRECFAERSILVGRREAGDCGARSVQGKAQVQIWGRARGGARLEHGAHVRDAGGVEGQQLVEGLRVSKHAAHVRDAGGVETQRLVERRRALPRVESRECGAGRGIRASRREAAGNHTAAAAQGIAACRGGPDTEGWGWGAREERTENIWFMLVTLEVAQLEMSASKFSKPSKSSLMSVMAETSHSAMGPYVAMATAGFASKAWTAVVSLALVVKT